MLFLGLEAREPQGRKHIGQVRAAARLQHQFDLDVLRGEHRKAGPV